MAATKRTDASMGPSTGERLGILGGTFDPVHIGHLVVAREMMEAHRLDRLILLPAYRPPHKDPGGVSDASDRVAMLRAATADTPDLEIDTREIDRGGRSYTVITLEELRKERPDAELFFLIGADSLPQLKTWYESTRLVELAHFATAVRPGFPLDSVESLRGAFTDAVVDDLKALCVQTTPIGVSSTQIRRNVSEGKSIRYLVPPAVERYIAEHGLYRPDGSETPSQTTNDG